MTVRKKRASNPPIETVRVPTGTSADLEQVTEYTLPDRTLELVETYEAVVGDRDRFLWKWAYHLFPEFTLSSVPEEFVEALRTDKLVALLFVSILDDVAEKRGDRATFEEAAKIPFDHQTPRPGRDGVDEAVLRLAGDVWDQFAPSLFEGPRADEFEEIVRFDLKQVLDAMAYSRLANENLDALTEFEIQTYDAHNMMLYGFADIDLVHSPTFDRSELSTLRRVIDRAQQMVRIGNWVTTWERELAEGDFTSGIVAAALDRDIVSVRDLRASREDETGTSTETIAQRIRDHDVEEVFLAQWHEELAEARSFEGQFDSVDVGSYLDGIETVMAYHLASRGLK